MESGVLVNKVTFQKQVVSVDEYGHESVSYVDDFTTRAEVIYNSGNRDIQNQEVFYDTTLTFRVRYYCPVEETMRIKYQDKQYRIININPEKLYYNRKTIIAEIVNE